VTKPAGRDIAGSLESQRTFDAFSAEYVEVVLKHDPVGATRAGVHDYDAHLPDDSPDGVRARLTWLRDVDQRLVASVPWEELPLTHRVDFALMRSLLASARASLEDIRPHASNPALYPHTAIESIHLLASRSFAPLEERKEALLSRLMAIPEYLEGARLSLQQTSPPLFALAREINLSGPSYIDDVVRRLLQAFPGEAERVEHAGERARAGFIQYQEFLDRELRKRGEIPIAIGERWMNHLLEREHLLSVDCAFIDAHARECMFAVGRELEAEARRLDPSRSWRELVVEARRRHPEPLQLMDAYEAERARAHAFVAERFGFAEPATTLALAETPEFERGTVPFAALMPPAPFDAEPLGVLCVTPIELGGADDTQDARLGGHDAVTLALRVARETWPGRQLQACVALGTGSRLRRLAASPLAQQGWALEAQDWMLEAGYVADPHATLFALLAELEAAALAVIDVGLHTGQMSVPEAAAFVREQAMVPGAVAFDQAMRCVGTPTRGLAALIGWDLVREMRREWRTRHGGAGTRTSFAAAYLGVGMLPPFLAHEELKDSAPA
jgi:uncharacterized protein (DUF885 family)